MRRPVQSPWLCAKYDARINVGVRSAISAANCLYEYVYKRPDRAAVEIGNGEIKAYLGGRYFSDQEACWRLLVFDIHGKYHTVDRLRVRLAAEQIAHFRGDELIGDISALPGKDAALTEWFAGNSEYADAATGGKYRDFPKYFACGGKRIVCGN